MAMGKAVRKGLLALSLGVLCLAAGPAALAEEAAAFHPALTEAEGREGDLVELRVPYDGSLGEIGAFAVQVEFDRESFEYVRVKHSSQVSGAYHDTLVREGWLGSAYSFKERERCLKDACETFTYYFRVKEGAQPGEKSFSAAVQDMAGPSAEALHGGAEVLLPYTVLPPLSQEAALLVLQPDSGQLVPDFSPECLEYDLAVPFQVTSLSFQAQPSEGAYCRVNRKNLGAGGSDTLFLLTVTAEDGKTKAVYRVTVHRGEKPAALGPSAGSASKPSQSPGPAGSSGTERDRAPKASALPAAAETAVPGSTPEPAGTASPPAPAQTAEPAPSIVVHMGESSMTPLVLAALILGVSILLSGPLSAWLGRKFRELSALFHNRDTVEKEDEEREDEKKKP